MRLFIYVPHAVKLSQRHHIVASLESLKQAYGFQKMHKKMFVVEKNSARWTVLSLSDVKKKSHRATAARGGGIVWTAAQSAAFSAEMRVRVCAGARVPVTHRRVSAQQLWGSRPHGDVSVAMETARAGGGAWGENEKKGRRGKVMDGDRRTLRWTGR